MKKVRMTTAVAYLDREEVQKAVKCWLYEEHSTCIGSSADVKVHDGGATVTLWTVEEDYGGGKPTSGN
jgi:hypothetical protein